MGVFGSRVSPRSGKLAASGRENALLSIAIQEKSAFQGMAFCFSDINFTITWKLRKCQV
ncbi:MAG: hypothetical protein LH628_02505 [Microcoleus sp. CAN_BIN18]|nr:hypothetical protein [Microcoleus sp. CAN_BIN18]